MVCCLITMNCFCKYQRHWVIFLSSKTSPVSSTFHYWYKKSIKERKEFFAFYTDHNYISRPRSDVWAFEANEVAVLMLTLKKKCQKIHLSCPLQKKRPWKRWYITIHHFGTLDIRIWLQHFRILSQYSLNDIIEHIT